MTHRHGRIIQADSSILLKTFILRVYNENEKEIFAVFGHDLTFPGYKAGYWLTTLQAQSAPPSPQQN